MLKFILIENIRYGGVYLWMLYVSSTYQYIDNVKIKRINDINKLISVKIS